MKKERPGGRGAGARAAAADSGAAAGAAAATESCCCPTAIRASLLTVSDTRGDRYTVVE